MRKKIYALIIGCAFICTSLIFTHHDEIYKVTNINSPVDIVLNGAELTIKDYDCFDSYFTPKNESLAKDLQIKEEEAFILGNLGKYWASNLLKGRFVILKGEDDLIYLKFNYIEKFKYSGFCLKDGKPFYKEGFEKRLKDIRRTKYVVLDLDSDEYYEVNSPKARSLKRFLVIKKVHLPRHYKKSSFKKQIKPEISSVDTGTIKIFFTDSTTKLKPDRNCNSSICKEILSNISNSKESIDMAIYGYSRTPEIEKALLKAKDRGVKIRLIYDSDAKGNNIYPDTDLIKKLFPDSVSDKNSAEVQNIMHNKFYIFDNKILITGSANLSHTDMSGFNSNSMVVIESEEAAKIYKQEFDQMYNGNFHNSKTAVENKSLDLSGTKIKIYFSPQDKSIANGIIPLIESAKKYIYVPTFVLTDRKTTAALISAKQRGVDVRVIIDALNASVQHSKHKELRNGGILVKTENYAGKMHSKSIIIDDKYTVIGSMNFSYSGENKNDENLLIIENPEITKAYKSFFLYQWDKIDDKWLNSNARAEGKDSIGSCFDGLDNNYDGRTDMDDPACR